jgi:hypothetical protein
MPALFTSTSIRPPSNRVVRRLRGTIEIGGHEVGSAPAGANLFNDFGAALLAAAAHDHVCFLGGEGDGYGPPDVAR